ncbi:MAG: hypothetical protein WA777_15180 [Rhodanobacter sp.]
MQMLAAGGVQCTGEAPSYEDMHASGAVDSDWFAMQGGKAVKVLDPHRAEIPRNVPSLVIWLDRRASEQAKSIAKMLEELEGLPRLNHWQRKQLHTQLAADTLKAIRSCHGLPTLVMQFEMILAKPEESATRIARHLREVADLDILKMAAAVRPRSPLCAPDLSMEITLANEARAAHE